MKQERPDQQLRRRAQGAIIENALFDWKSGVIIALTIVLAFFGQWDEARQAWPLLWPWWYFLIGGAVAWIALVVSMLFDPAANAKAVADLLRHDFDPKLLRNDQPREWMRKALEYRQSIANTVARTRQSVLRDHLSEAASQIDEWLSNLYQLAQRLDMYETDEVIRQDARSVPRDIQTLQAKLKVEDDASVRQQMEQTIESKKAQLANLQQLENTMQKAELQMDGTLTAMGTIYSQLLLINVKDVDSGRAQRLREGITEQVKQLQDVASSMDEVYHARA